MPKMNFTLALVFFFSFLLSAQANYAQNILSGAYPPEKIEEILISTENWQPFPTIQQRNPWEQLSEVQKTQFIRRGEVALLYKWPSLPATLFLEFARNGNRSRYQAVRSERREKVIDLLFAELIENKGRFIDQIVNGLWLICEETYWGVPAHLYLQKAGNGLPDITEPTVDLFAAQTLDLLAWTDYLLNTKLDEVSPLVRPRIRHEADRRILTPNFERDDFYWMGFDLSSRGGRRPNNWNPWINSNWLTGVLLLEENPERRIKTAHKIMQSLDNFLNPHPADGGCDEGPGYWGHAGGSVFDCLELFYSASDGKIDVYDQPLIQNMGKYIYRAYIDDPYYVNFADASAKIHLKADLVYRYGERIDDEKMKALGAFSAQKYPDEILDGRSVFRRISALFNLPELMNYEGAAPYVRDAWLPDIQVMTARAQEGSAKGLYLAAKGGHNNESHNHNDVGNFIIYKDGQPVIIDAGSGTYTARTFSPRRYELWNNNTDYHSLPSIGGVVQQAGREFEATDVQYKASENSVKFSLDIAKAYPSEAGLTSWKRELEFRRNKDISLTDAYALEKEAEHIQQNFLTICQVAGTRNGQVKFFSPETKALLLTMEYDPKQLEFKLEKLPLDQPEDEKIIKQWGKNIYRIQLIDQQPGTKGNYKIKFF